MGLWKSFAGVLKIEITSATPPEMLTAINNLGITLFNITYSNDLCVCGNIYRHDFSALNELLTRRGEKLKVLKRSGLFWTIANLRKRPLMIIGFMLFLVLALYLPTRVFFVSVDGNTNVPAQLIIEKANSCGIRFGASRREVRSERMKNALLAAIPELQWAGVNTRGCVAVISVQERSVVTDRERKAGVGSVVATEDGIIREITVLRGNPLCKVGQAVKKGQTLVSGYTDCGIMIKAEVADAEILAQTLHTLESVTPVSYIQRGEEEKIETRYCLRIGKNIINFDKDSGISDATCVKMYEEIDLILPGGFRLPISIMKETLIYTETQVASNTDSDSYIWMPDSLELYLQDQMLAGQILASDIAFSMGEEICRLNGKYACLEMIGRVCSEEIIQGNGKRN